MKTQIKNLVKSALFGVTVLGGAMVMQSFGEAENAQSEMHLVNKGSSYEPRPSYSSSNCLDVSNETCAYEVLSPENIPDESSFSPTEIQNFLNQGWISALPATGEYQN